MENEAGGRSFGKVGMVAAGCGGAVLLVALLACGACTLGWGTFVSFGVASDMSDHEVSVRGSDLPQGDKDRLLQQIDRVRELSRHKRIGFLKYLSYDETLGALSDDGLAPDELVSFERELGRLEAELGGSGPPPAPPAR